MSERRSRYEEIVVQVMPFICDTPEEGSLQTAEPRQGHNAAPFPNTAAPSLQRLVQWAQNVMRHPTPDVTQTYDVLIYTACEFPGLDDADKTAPEQEAEVGGLPLAGREQIVVHWEYYKDYIAPSLRGEGLGRARFWNFKNYVAALFRREPPHQRFWDFLGLDKDQRAAILQVRDKLFEIPSPALRDLLYSPRADVHRPIRVWWHCRTPELADLPWELLAYELRQQAQTQFSFVRGLPPARALPMVPIAGRLRLAFIYEVARTSEALQTALKQLAPVLDVVEMTEPPREALQRAAREGFELIHLVTDGALSLGHEAILYLCKPPIAASESKELTQWKRLLYKLGLRYTSLFRFFLKDQQLLEWNDKLYKKLDLEACTPRELSTLLRGSRVTVLGLSALKTEDDPYLSSFGARPTSAYGAFASFGSSSLPLPNIVAPLWDGTDAALAAFWGSFYARLAEANSFSVEEAMAVGQQAAPSALMALFLRQRLGREFTSRAIDRSPAFKEPTQIHAELEVARDLITQLHAIDSNYKDIETKITDMPLVQSEETRQSKLEDEITSLTQLEELDG